MKIRNVSFLVVLLSLLFTTAFTEREVVEPSSVAQYEASELDVKHIGIETVGQSCVPVSFSSRSQTSDGIVLLFLPYFRIGLGTEISVTASDNWTASTDASWIYFPRGNSGNGNGSFAVLSVTSPAPGTSRSATVTIDAGCSGTISFVVAQSSCGLGCI